MDTRFPGRRDSAVCLGAVRKGFWFCGGVCVCGGGRGLRKRVFLLLVLRCCPSATAKRHFFSLSLLPPPISLHSLLPSQSLFLTIRDVVPKVPQRVNKHKRPEGPRRAPVVSRQKHRRRRGEVTGQDPPHEGSLGARRRVAPAGVRVGRGLEEPAEAIGGPAGEEGGARRGEGR